MPESFQKRPRRVFRTGVFEDEEVDRENEGEE
jgi:hypothetical protein